jgi:hypothetical protein
MGIKFWEVVCDEHGIGGDGEYCGDNGDGTHLVTALARLNVQNLTRRKSMKKGSRREKMSERSGE